ncbi:MAG: D-tyrosyl-tRNA(Tyr) deacylase [Synergistaceae bacterium]|nr:D-tyrosyl-tRNA(Tyr) deacylase [Synergistaceae bacterium]
MRIVAQRVTSASVEAEGKVVGSIGRGLCVFVGIARKDTERECSWAAKKTAMLRIFDDGGGKMNRSLLDIGGEALIVSQFTLCADCKKGNRPSYAGAAPPEEANALYESFAQKIGSMGIRTQMGVFGAAMKVGIANDGPVTIVLDSADMPGQDQGGWGCG